MKKFFRKYGKSISIFLLAAVVVSSLVIAVNVFAPSKAEACRDQGCNVYFWKSHHEKWVEYLPDDALRTLFSGADLYQLGSVTLHNALKEDWGSSSCTPLDKAIRGVLREGVAAKLNVSNPAIDYHVSGSQVTQMVNGALASGNIQTMLSVTTSLTGWNNSRCPWVDPK